MKHIKRTVAWALALMLGAQTALPSFAAHEQGEEPAEVPELTEELALPLQPEELLDYVSGAPVLQDSPLLLASVTAGDFTYETVSESECHIIGYSGEQTQLTVPGTLDGYTVTGIGERAFAGKTALVSVTLPDSIAFFGRAAFDGCTALEDINYPAGLTSVGGGSVSSMGHVFANCPALKRITVPEGVTAIPMYAFQGCGQLETVTLPESLATVGSRAFCGSGLKTVTLPDGVTQIGESAFASCAALESATLPGGVGVVETGLFSNCTALETVVLKAGITELKPSAFQGCGALTALSLPNGLQTVGEQAFAGCRSLVGVTLPDSIAFLGRAAFDGCTALAEVNYPAGLTSVGGGSVSSMGHVFANCPALKHITVPEGVTAIPKYAFQGCGGLETVTLPESLATVGSRAFYGSGLKSLTLPDGVTQIGEAAFAACTALAALELGTELTSIGSDAFNGCTALGEVEIAGCPVIGANAFVNCTGLRRVTLGAGVREIGDGAFANCSGLTALSLPAGLERIGQTAFSGCSALQSVVLPDSVTTLGGRAFENCVKLSSVNYPAALASLPGFNVNARGSVFAGCTALTTVTVPEGVTAIPEFAFRGCNTLREILLPETVTSVGANAFWDCTALRKVYVPAAVTQIGANAFADCAALTIHGVEGSFAQQYALDNGIPFTTDSPLAPVSGLDGLVLTDEGQPLGGVTVTLYHVETGDTAFTLVTDDAGRWSTAQALQGQTYRVYYHCAGYDITPQNREYRLGETGQTAQTAVAVKAQPLPDGESGGFAYTVLNGTYCKITGYTGGDTHVRVPRQLDGYLVQSLADGLFRNQTQLQSVVLPDTVETVGRELFAGCTGLTAVWLSDNLQDTGVSAFAGCTALKSITLPGSLQVLGSEAFRGCTALEQVSLPEGLETVGIYAFSGCTALERITLPDSIRSLGSRAFENCTALAAVNYPMHWAECPGTNAYTGSRGSVFQNCPLLTSITVPEGVTAIPDYAFRGSSSLTEITLPEGLKTVGVSAFEALNIAEMHLPATVEVLGESAFAECTALEAFSAEGLVTLGKGALRSCTALREVTLGDSLRTLSQDGFRGCTALVRLDLGEGVETIGLYAFENCTALQSVVLPDSLTTLASGAFSGCTALKTVNYPVNWVDCPSPNAYNSNQGFVFENTALTELVIPEGVTAIPDYAFRGCASLTAVTLPQSLAGIGEFAFCGTGLERVDLPEGLKVLRNGAFEGCADLTLVRAPFAADDDLETLGSGVLSNCGEGLTVWCCSASKMHYYAEGAGIAVELLDDHEHTMEETLRQEPACQADGLSVTRCTLCGYEQREVLARLGHEFETEYTVDVPATCQREGSRSYHCTRCDAVTGEQSLPATGHSLTGWVVTTAPTVLREGEKTRGCNYCDLTETAVMAALVLTEEMRDQYGLVHFSVVHAQELTPVAEAAICVETSEGDLTCFTDGEGRVSMILPVGKLPVMVQAPGCKSRSLKINVQGGEQELPQIGVSERDPVQVELKHHLMTYEEIIAAGIDPNAPGNSHVYKYELTITFIPVLDFLSLTYLFAESGQLLRFPEIVFPGPGGGDDGHGSGERRDGKFYIGEPVDREDEYGYGYASFWHNLWNGEEARVVVTEKFLLIIYGEVKWLKEMFDVEMIILNASETDTIEQCEAELIVPGGLSLAAMLPEKGQQTYRRQVPDIEPGGSHSLHWYLRGDAEGSYDIKATLEGMMMPFEEPFYYEYVAEEPIKVYAGSALQLTLTVEDVVYYGTDAHITITLQNVSDRTLYNVSHVINNTVQKRVVYTTKDGKTTVHKETIGESGGTTDCNYVVAQFHPGDRLVVEGTIEICFDAKALKQRFKDLLDEMLALSNSFNAITEAFDAGESVIDATSDISDALDSGLISTDTIKASDSLSALTDYADFSKGKASQSGGRPGFMRMLHDLVDSLPIRYVLQNVSVKTLEDSTTDIPWVINTIPGPPVNPLIPAGSISMTKLIYSIAILLIDRQDVKVGGMTLAKDYTNTAEAMEYVTYCWEQTAAIRAADPSGEAHWRTYYVPANRARSAGDPVTIEIDNDTAEVDENGVWTFTGPAVIQVTPHTMESGTLYVQEGDNEPKAYVISVVEPHECDGSRWQVGVPATEHTVGFRYENCDTCGEMCNVENLRSCGSHIFAPWLMEVAPDGTYHGVETRTCTKCGVLEYRFVDKCPADSPAGLVTEASGTLANTDEGLCLVVPEGATAESLFATLTYPEQTRRQAADGTLLEQQPLATGQTLSAPGLEGVLTLVLPGDATGDGAVDAGDADRALAFAAGEPGSGAERLAADVDGDGEVTLEDAVLLACKAAQADGVPAKTLLALYGEGGQMLQVTEDAEAVPTDIPWQQLALFLLDGDTRPLTPAVTYTAQ